MSRKRGALWIERSLIHSPFYIGLCLTEAHFRAEMKRLNVDEDKRPRWLRSGYNGKVHFLERKGKHVAIVCMRPGRCNLSNIGLLVHEAVHVWQEIRDSLNEDNPSSEFEAISIQAIAQRLIEKYERMWKARRKQHENI